jgi:hypothetical protein
LGGDLGEDKIRKLKRISRGIGFDSGDRFHLARNVVQAEAFMNSTVNVLYKIVVFLTSRVTSCTMEYIVA